MADPTFTELTTPLTSDEMKSTTYSALAIVGTDTTVWKPGAVVRTIIAIFSVMYAAFTTWASNAVKALFLLTGSDPNWLRSVAKYDYGVDFIPAGFATGAITIVNSGAGVYSWGPGELSISATLTIRGVPTVKLYHNTASISLGASTTISGVPIEADEIGADSTASAGQINTLSPPINNISVSNPTAIVGNDDESNTALVTRCLAQASAVSPNGPRDAYRAVLLAATRPNGTQIADQIKVLPGNPVQVVAGSLSGALSSDDLAALDAIMQTRVVPIGVTATIASATEHTLDIALSVRLYQGTQTDNEVEAAIGNALIDAIKALQIGGDPPFTAGAGSVYADVVIAATKSVSPDIFDVSISSPSFPVALLATDRVVLGTVDITLTRYART